MVVCCFCLLSTSAFAAAFTASLDRDTCYLGETVTLSLTFSGAEARTPPQPPEVPGLGFNYVGQSSQISIANGKMESTVTHTFIIAPKQTGSFTIPSINAVAGTERLSTQPLQLRVVKPSATAPETANTGTEIALLRLQLPRQEFYVGEVVGAELQLLVRQEVQGVQGFQLTGFPSEGFNTGKIVEAGRRQLRLGNAVYTVIPLQLPVKAVRVGPSTLGPVTATVVVQLPRRRGRDPWADPFSFFGGEQRQLSLATQELAVNVVPLPPNAPASFKGAVGEFTLAGSVGPTNVAVGDPITVKLQISGRGALDNLELPDQPTWAGFKSYPPTSKLETNDPLGIQGVKTFEQVVVPENPDLKQLPPLLFTYFDPEAKNYRTLTQPGVSLVVRPSGASPTPVISGQSREESQPAGPDIVHIKPRPGMVAQLQGPILTRPWFVALQLMPVLALIGATLYRRRTEHLANNPRLRRQREVAATVQNGIKRLRELASQNNSDEFFALLFRLLQEQTAERLGLPASAITEAVVDEQLEPRGVAPDITDPLQELFQACNLARYAPLSSGQELAALIPKLEDAVARLQALKL